MDYLVAEAETALLRQTIAGTPRVKTVHDIRTREMGDLIVDDAHIEVDTMLTVEARRRAKSRSREVAKVMGGLT